MQIEGKVVVITGGASGIGAACARAFTECGATVAVADINSDGAAEVAAEIDGLAVTCDVGREDDIIALVEKTSDALGPIDLFFSNAGLGSGGDPLSAELSTWQHLWEVNLMAHVYAIRAVLPTMLERGDGYLIHTASMAGILTSQGDLPYAVTKHALVGLAEWMSITYHNRGIRTSLLAPLGVRTPMLGDPNGPLATTSAGPIKEPEEVADMVIEAVRSERFLILTDPLAAKWMGNKASDLERWLNGMRRLQTAAFD
jgi:NAD(P)-dependent dehydrogenase (short-subunit alcohol dehydrogenase family)|tara:strand:+ start:938 stop:1708 length:771 start_codon:yes stop_codon:yes gene_type:complete